MSDKIREALAGMLAIVDESRGVDGYHLSGDIAEWDTFPEVEIARAALAQQPAQVSVPDELRQHILHMRRELTRLDRSPLNVRQRLAQRVTELLAAAAPAAPKPKEPVDANAMAAQLAPMITEWVDGGLSMGLDWRLGLTSVIARRIRRLTAAPAAQEPVAWVADPEHGSRHKEIDWFPEKIDAFPVGTKLYAAPPTVTAAQEPIKLSDEVREFLQEWIDSATGGEDADVDYGFANQLAVLLGPLYTAPPAAEQPGLPELLIALGEKGVAVNGGTHGDKWKVSLPSAEQPDTVKAPRELLDRAATLLELFCETGSTYQELHALLGKEGTDHE